MPTYEYKCDNNKCNCYFDIKQSFDDDALVTCPLCKEDTLYKVIGVPHVFIYQEPSTVGHLAERNTKQMGNYEYESRVNEQSEGKTHFAKTMSGNQSPVPGMTPEKYSKLINATPEQTRRYIDTGNI